MNGFRKLSRVFYQTRHVSQQKRLFLAQYRCLAVMSSNTRDQAMGQIGSKNKAKNAQPDSQQKVNYVTRQKVADKEAKNEWADEKERFLKMPKEDKRAKYYKCGKYTEIDDITVWPQYVQENCRPKSTAPNPEVDDTLNQKISLWKGDLTTIEIDAIVNAANESLLGGGGVDGAIHRAAGKTLMKECRSLAGCKTGDAKVTGGYKLPAKYIIHTVGPMGEISSMLRSCYKTCLKLAAKHKCRTIAFPCVSTGIYGYDVSKATPVVMETVKNWLMEEQNLEKIDRIIFCVFLKKDVSVYEQNLLKFFPVNPSINVKARLSYPCDKNPTTKWMGRPMDRNCSDGEDEAKSEMETGTLGSANGTEESSEKGDSKSEGKKDNVDTTLTKSVKPAQAPDAKRIRKAEEEPMEQSDTCEQTVKDEKPGEHVQDEGKVGKEPVK